MTPTADAAKDTASDNGGRRAIDPYTLRFTSPAREADYRAGRSAADLRYTRFILCLVFLLTLAVVPLDMRLFPSSRWPSLFLGHGLEILLLVILFGLSFVPFFRTRHMTLMAALSVLFVAIYGAWDVMFSVSEIYVAGGAVVVMAIYILLPLDFVHGLAAGIVCSVLYLAIIGLGHPMQYEPYLILLFFLATANAIGAISRYHVERLRRLDFANLRTIDSQRGRYRDLLVRILPQPIADRLQRGEARIADRFDDTTVLFADLVGFTVTSAHHAPEEVVAFLDRVFAAFDALVDWYGVEKIKTIGDAYMVASGVPTVQADHAATMADLALDMLAAVHAMPSLDTGSVEVRIGIASGPVVAGVIGDTRFNYDLWGDTVNVASRMEATGEPGRIQVSEETHRRLAASHVLEPRGDVEMKGLGPVPTWYLRGRRGGEAGA